MWTHNSKSFILYIYFNGASTSPFAACSVNDKKATKKLSNLKIVTAASVGSLFVSFPSKFWCFGRAKIKARALAIIVDSSRLNFRAAKTWKFARKPHGNTCYAGYSHRFRSVYLQVTFSLPLLLLLFKLPKRKFRSSYDCNCDENVTLK